MRPLLAVLLSCAALVAPSRVSAQNITEWSSEIRITLAFKVNPDALQKLLPAGWVSVPSTAPGTPGANLNVTMMERVIVLDPQGKPLRTGSSRYMVLGVPVRNTQTGQTNTMIAGGLSPEGAGAYGVYLTATTATVERTVSGEAETHAKVQEAWTFAAASGERVELRVRKTGPKQMIEGDRADFFVLIENTGDKTLTNFQVIDTYDASLRPLQADPAESRLEADRVVWYIGQLGPGERRCREGQCYLCNHQPAERGTPN